MIAVEVRSILFEVVYERWVARRVRLPCSELASNSACVVKMCDSATMGPNVEPQ